MEPQRLEEFRRVLTERERSVLRRRRRTLEEEGELLAEREPDWEDLAAERSAASVLDSVTESERVTVAQIQAALARIDAGTYGECVACHAPIDRDRLRAVPEADRCARCADRP